MRNNFFMAHCEFKELARPFDWGLLRRMGRRVEVVSAALGVTQLVPTMPAQNQAESGGSVAAQ